MINNYYDICVVGGCGHVGLPLALCFTKEGKKVAIFDVNEQSVTQVLAGKMPFREKGADELLENALSRGLLVAGTTRR